MSMLIIKLKQDKDEFKLEAVKKALQASKNVQDWCVLKFNVQDWC
jgi:hypothetical protein